MVKTMNKLIGYLKIRQMINKNIDRNMALMDTDYSNKCLGHSNSINRLDFFETYCELRQMILQMEEGEKKVFVSMPKESNLDNYSLFSYVRPDDMLMHFEKKDGKTKCTLNKKSLKLKRDYYAKRIKEQN